MTVDDLRRLGGDRQLSLSRGRDPMLARKVGYVSGQRLARQAAQTSTSSKCHQAGGSSAGAWPTLMLFSDEGVVISPPANSDGYDHEEIDAEDTASGSIGA